MVMKLNQRVNDLTMKKWKQCVHVNLLLSTFSSHVFIFENNACVCSFCGHNGKLLGTTDFKVKLRKHLSYSKPISNVVLIFLRIISPFK